MNYSQSQTKLSFAVAVFFAITILASTLVSVMSTHALGGYTVEGWVYVDVNESEELDRLGASLGLDEEDDESAYYELPFDFPFYESLYSELLVNTNGQLCFDTEGDCTGYDEGIDYTSDGPFIAPLWTDLTNDYDFEGHSTDVFVYEASDHVVFQWRTLDYSYNFPIEFSATLHDDGTINFDYGQYQADESLSYNNLVQVGVSDGDGEYELICGSEGYDEDSAPGFESLEGYYLDCDYPHYTASVEISWNSLDENYDYSVGENEFDPFNSEGPLSGVQVQLYAVEEETELHGAFSEEGDDPIGSAMTDEDGHYSIQFPGYYDELLVVVGDEDVEGYELYEVDPEAHVFMNDSEEEGDIGIEEEGDGARNHAVQNFGFVEVEEPEVIEEVDDTDGIDNEVEAAAPNGGDANGDGMTDSKQDYVGSTVNPVTEEYAVVEVTAGTTLGAVSFVAESTLEAQDPETDYPVGLANFTANCGAPGCSTTVKLTYDKEYDTSTWSFKKFQDGAYTDISSIVTYATANVGGNTVTTVSYDLTDGGVYDDDGIENGVIVDPAGPSVEVLAATGSEAFVLPALGVAMAGTAMGALYFSRRRVVKIKVQFL